jgi:glycyl-tRNA synthetase
MKIKDKVMNLAKRRGFIWGPSPNLYQGGLAGFYDWGPLGKLLKNKVENILRKGFMSFNFWEVECPTIMPKQVWDASGHLGGFTDPVSKCLKCNAYSRIDELIQEKFPKVDAEGMSFEKLEDFIQKKKLKCPSCGGSFGSVQAFNLMMKTTLGLDKEAYLRPETATTTYLLFPEYYRFFRTKMPFGVFQIGKAYRNEISPRQGVFRTREFTQAESQLFILKHQEKKYDKLKDYKKEILPLMKNNSKIIKKVKVGNLIKEKYVKHEAFAYMIYIAYKLLLEMGFDPKKIRIRQHSAEKLAHYAEDAWDLEIKTDRYGWFELCGIHDRKNYDLKRHSEFSKTKMEVSGEIPSILEIAFGLERVTYSLLENSLVNDQKRDWLNFKKNMAPIDIGIFPLTKKDGLDKLAKEIFSKMSDDFVCIYDESGSIGKRYRRMDEIGTNLCITIDHDSIENKDVTIREISSMKQIRVKIEDLKNIIKDLLNGNIKLEDIKW